MALIQTFLTDLLQTFIANTNSNNNWLNSAKMNISDYVKGTGHANTNKADHAIAADTADAAYAGSVLASGWNLITQTLTYSAADAPTFTATTSAGLTPFISVGMKIMLTNTTVKYFIVTAITPSTITLYGGTDYTLVSAAISSVYYSPQKAPFGFPLDPVKWSVIFGSASAPYVTSPTVWFQVSGYLQSIPIGKWKGTYKVAYRLYNASGSTAVETAQITISSDGTTETNPKTTCNASGLTLTADWAYGTVSAGDVFTFAAKTNLYFLVKSSSLYVYLDGAAAYAYLRAECAYL
jgi:hypothetical protein